MFGVQVHEVDWKLHANCVYGFAWNDPQSLAPRELLAAQQALIAFSAATGNFKATGQYCVARQVQNLQANARDWL